LFFFVSLAYFSTVNLSRIPGNVLPVAQTTATKHRRKSYHFEHGNRSLILGFFRTYSL